ncbi:MAG: YajQ family cyclic di-GMP-binding protein [Candidatus Cloacimonadota bacterium]|nr:MAG: YajQ family cyclic di-GMP-binding protein [Candidatus Cloacimonadota bacterium]
MSSFDITCEVDWPEVENAVNQATKELNNRFDFRGVECNIKIDQKGLLLTLECSEDGKLDAMVDILQTKLVKRDVSLFGFEYQTPVPSSGRSVRQLIDVKSGIDKEKGKEIIKVIKESKIKVNPKMQGDSVRVNGSKRDDLQKVIQLIKTSQDSLKMALQTGNFRD